MLMTTLPGDGTTKWNWVLCGVLGTTASLQRDSFLVGRMGLGSDGPGTIYNPPCSQGPGRSFIRTRRADLHDGGPAIELLGHASAGVGASGI